MEEGIFHHFLETNIGIDLLDGKAKINEKNERRQIMKKKNKSEDERKQGQHL